MLEGKKYQPCYQDRAKNLLIMALLYQQKWDNAMNVKMEFYAEDVIIKLMKIKYSKLT